MGAVEDHEPVSDGEPEDSDQENTTQTADDIVSASLASGALSEVCDVTAVMRELDDKESDLVKEFVSRGCSCDFGPRKTPCSMLFPLKHYQSLRATLTEMSHDELDLFVMGQIMAHCYQSSTLQATTAPVLNKEKERMASSTTMANVFASVPSCSSRHRQQEVQGH